MIDYYTLSEEIDNNFFKEVYVDIDLKYGTFDRTNIFKHMLDNYHEIQSAWDNVISEIYIRKSSSGNVHLKLVIDKDYDLTFPYMMMLRTMLFDDPLRIGLDMRRVAKHGLNEVNRIFSTKIKDGSVNHVGEWITLTDYIAGVR